MAAVQIIIKRTKGCSRNVINIKNAFNNDEREGKDEASGGDNEKTNENKSVEKSEPQQKKCLPPVQETPDPTTETPQLIQSSRTKNKLPRSYYPEHDSHDSLQRSDPQTGNKAASNAELGPNKRLQPIRETPDPTTETPKTKQPPATKTKPRQSYFSEQASYDSLQSSNPQTGDKSAPTQKEKIVYAPPHENPTEEDFVSDWDQTTDASNDKDFGVELLEKLKKTLGPKQLYDQNGKKIELIDLLKITTNVAEKKPSPGPKTGRSSTQTAKPSKGAYCVNDERVLNDTGDDSIGPMKKTFSFDVTQTLTTKSQPKAAPKSTKKKNNPSKWIDIKAKAKLVTNTKKTIILNTKTKTTIFVILGKITQVFDAKTLNVPVV